MLIGGSVQAAGENAKLPVGLFCRDAASGSACGSGRVPKEYALITAPLPSLPDGKISQHGGQGHFAMMLRQAALAVLVVNHTFTSPAAQGKAPVFLKTGALSKGAQPLDDYIWRFFRNQPQSCQRGRGVRKTARKSARYQANSGN